MMAARAAMLLGAVLIVLVAFGAADPDTQPSALRLLASAAVALLAPLLWPGAAATRRATLGRVVAWSAVACCIAILPMVTMARTKVPLPDVLQTCAVLALMLLVSHAAVAMLDGHWSQGSGDSRDAREMAGRSVVMTLALLGSMPFWLGPGGELFSARHASAIDTMLGLSPLTHLAVASGNDLLRNPWLYQHSNLAGLQFDYPGLASLVWCYIALLLGVLAMAAARSDRPMEKTR